MKIQTKRVYDRPSEDDGFRVLVDRVWPRGLSKDKLRLDLWLKDAAPSADLRKWFGHEPARWTAFRDRYFSELQAQQQAVQQLLELAAKGRLTLLFSARDIHHNQAVALREYLLARIGKIA
jgi:uncharacterized protein YeaO (DUF488 family)